MTKLAPEWVRTNDPVIRSPARYRWTTAPATKRVEEYPQRVHLSQDTYIIIVTITVHHQKACSLGYISPGESTLNCADTHMSLRRHVLRRLANRRKSPTPDYQALTIRSRTINLRHRGSRQPPQGPASRRITAIAGLGGRGVPLHIWEDLPPYTGLVYWVT